MPSHYNPDEFSQLHKTVSKSFAMQRKTLVRVLGLEGRVSELELQQIADEKAQEGIEEILDEMREKDSQEEAESGEDYQVPMTEDEKEFKKTESFFDTVDRAVSTKKRPKKPIGKKIPQKKKPKIKAKKKKIKAKDIGYSSRVFGKDQSGEYLSSEERKRRFKLGDAQPAGELSKDVVEPPEQEKSTSKLDGITGTVKAIAASVDRIKDSLTGQSKVQEDAIEDARKSDEEKEAKKREGGLEKFLGPVKAAGEKLLAPIKSMWSSVWEFIQTIILGRAAFKLFEWFSDPANTEKVSSIFKFIADWWPVMLAGIMAFLPGLLGPVGMIAGVIALLAWGIPKIIDAVKSIFGFGKDVDKELKTGGDKLNKDIEISGQEAEKKLEPGAEKESPAKVTGDPSDSDTPAEVSGVQKSQQETQALAGGGPIEKKKEGEGGPVEGEKGKDKVPAMLTDGEFVMSKGAVQQYGADTLAGMNAAAGGTNKPSVSKGVSRYSGGGPVGQMPTESSGSDGDAGSTGSTESTSASVSVDGSVGSDNASSSGGGIFGAVKGVFGKATELFNPQIMIVKNLIGGIRDMVTKGHETMHKAMGAGKLEKHLKGHTKEEKKHKLIHKRISASAISQPKSDKMKPFGLGRLVAGGLDKLTGDKFDFDGRGISKDQKGRGDNITPPNRGSQNKAIASQITDSSTDSQAPVEPAPGVPDFDPAMMRSQSKIRTLGVSL